jgi:hypothetical protein
LYFFWGFSFALILDSYCAQQVQSSSKCRILLPCVHACGKCIPCLGKTIEYVGPWLWKKAKIKEERRNTNCMEGTLTDIGSKWLKKQKRRSKVRESYLLKEEIKDDRSERKIDRGTLSKRKKMSTSALEHLAENKERQAGEAREVRVKLT